MNITEYIEKTKHIQPPFYKKEYEELLKIKNDIIHSDDLIPHKEIGNFWTGYVHVCPKCEKKLKSIVSEQDYKNRIFIVYFCKECDYKIIREEKIL